LRIDHGSTGEIEKERKAIKAYIRACNSTEPIAGAIAVHGIVAVLERPRTGRGAAACCGRAVRNVNGDLVSEKTVQTAERQCRGAADNINGRCKRSLRQGYRVGHGCSRHHDDCSQCHEEESSFHLAPFPFRPTTYTSAEG
jgi:hypothetical protein